MGLSRTTYSILAVLLWLTSGPALSRTAGGLVQLIISKLPTTDARTYRDLRILAGKAPVQVLTLTKMEVYHVTESQR